jgi:multiple sugar transport system ATP-binding protein
MRAELKGVLQHSKTTTVYVTHDQVEAMSLADRIAVMHQGHIVQAADPMTVYRDPATRFVAGFIGNPPMNFLPATRDGAGWRVAGLAMTGPATDKARLDYAIRPEDLTPAQEGLSGTVKVTEPLGAHLLATLDVEGHVFRAVLDIDRPVRPGERLTLAPRGDRARWFDPETTTAIAA